MTQKEITIKFTINENCETPITKEDLFELFNEMTFTDKTLSEWEEVVENDN